MILPHKAFQGKFFRAGKRAHGVDCYAPHPLSHNTAEEEHAYEDHFNSGLDGFNRHTGA